MKTIVKHIFPAVLLLSISISARSQTVRLADLIRLAKASHTDATQYITTTLHFSLVSSGNVNGQVVSRYIKKEGDVSESIIKTQSPDANKSLHAIVDYGVSPKIFAQKITKELEQAKFKVTRKIHDKNKDDQLYDNSLYTVSVYTFADKKFPAAIELRVK